MVNTPTLVCCFLISIDDHLLFNRWMLMSKIKHRRNKNYKDENFMERPYRTLHKRTSHVCLNSIHTQCKKTWNTHLPWHSLKALQEIFHRRIILTSAYYSSCVYRLSRSRSNGMFVNYGQSFTNVLCSNFQWQGES